MTILYVYLISLLSPIVGKLGVMLFCKGGSDAANNGYGNSLTFLLGSLIFNIICGSGAVYLWVNATDPVSGWDKVLAILSFIPVIAFAGIYLIIKEIIYQYK